MTRLKKLNEYLFYEFTYDLSHSENNISENWPFELTLVGQINLEAENIDVYEFACDTEDYYLLDGSHIAFQRKDGLNLMELKYQLQGSILIRDQGLVQLNMSILGDESVPSVLERRNNILRIAQNQLKIEKVRILEGLFLKVTRSYLALVEDIVIGKKYVVGDRINEIIISKPELSAWRALAYEYGKLHEEHQKNTSTFR